MGQKPNEFYVPAKYYSPHYDGPAEPPGSPSLISSPGGCGNSSTVHSANTPSVVLTHHRSQSTSSSTANASSRKNSAHVGSLLPIQSFEENRSETYDPVFSALIPVIESLPSRYKLEASKPPKNELFNSLFLVGNGMAIKAFNRRETWERECRTLVKLQ